MTLPDGALRGQTRFEPTDDPGRIAQQQAAMFERLQNGGINMAGLRLHLRTAVPTDAPTANQPTVVLVDTGGGPHAYVFVTGTGWVAMSQTVTPAVHVLASTSGLGPEHSVSGLTAGQVLRASGATAAAFAALNFSDLAGTIANAQVPEGAVTQHEAALTINASQIVEPVLFLDTLIEWPEGNHGLWLDRKQDVADPGLDFIRLQTAGGTPLFQVAWDGIITGSGNGLTGIPLTGTTGTLGVTRGGTGLTSIAANAMLYASASNTLAALAPGTNNHVVTMVGGTPAWAAIPLVRAFTYPGNLTDIISFDGDDEGSGNVAHKWLYDTTANVFKWRSHGGVEAADDTENIATLAPASQLLDFASGSLQMGGNDVLTTASPVASHVLATTGGLGAEHSVSGLTAGQVLRATGATTAAFQSLVAGDIPNLDAGKITTGTFADARIAETSVTQHEAALTILASQVTAAIFATVVTTTGYEIQAGTSGTAVPFRIKDTNSPNPNLGRNLFAIVDNVDAALFSVDEDGVATAASYSGSGANLTGVDADLLDGIDSTGFLRPGVAVTITAIYSFDEPPQLQNEAGDPAGAGGYSTLYAQAGGILKLRDGTGTIYTVATTGNAVVTNPGATQTIIDTRTASGLLSLQHTAPSSDGTYDSPKLGLTGYSRFSALNDSDAWDIYNNVTGNNPHASRLRFDQDGVIKATIDASGNILAEASVYAKGDFFVFGASTSEGEYFTRSGNDIAVVAGGSTRWTFGGTSGHLTAAAVGQRLGVNANHNINFPSGLTAINSPGDAVVALDADNNQTGRAFRIRHNAAGAAGTLLFEFNEAGWLNLALAAGELRINGTKVVDSRQTVATTPTADLAGGSYTSTEQGMLNNLAAWAGDIDTALAAHGLID